MKSSWKNPLQEPFAVFAALGCLLYGVALVVQPSAPAETISIPAETIRGVIRQQEDVVGRELSREEVTAAVEGLVDDEVLLREARRRGLDQNDFRVRRRLLSVMRSALDEPVPEPSVAELQAYYRERVDRFRSEPSISLEQVFFPWGSELLPKDPAAFLEKLKTDPNPTSLGAFTLSGPSLQRMSRARLAMMFGGDFAGKVFALPLQRWSGPIESKSGVHYVRVSEHHPAEVPPFEKIETYLRQDWQLEKRREAQQKKIDALRARYHVELPEAFEARRADR